MMKVTREELDYLQEIRVIQVCAYNIVSQCKGFLCYYMKKVILTYYVKLPSA